MNKSECLYQYSILVKKASVEQKQRLRKEKAIYLTMENKNKTRGGGKEAKCNGDKCRETEKADKGKVYR